MRKKQCSLMNAEAHTAAQVVVTMVRRFREGVAALTARKSLRGGSGGLTLIQNRNRKEGRAVKVLLRSSSTTL